MATGTRTLKRIRGRLSVLSESGKHADSVPITYMKLLSILCTLKRAEDAYQRGAQTRFPRKDPHWKIPIDTSTGDINVHHVTWIMSYLLLWFWDILLENNMSLLRKIGCLVIINILWIKITRRGIKNEW